MPGRASGAERAAGRDRRTGGRGRAAARARARRRPAGGRSPGARGRAVPPRPHPRGGPGRAGPAARGAPCSWRWRGGWPRCPSCSRSPRSSTCRWSTQSRIRRSGGGSWGCSGAPPTRRALIGDYALVNALLTAALRLVDPADDGHAGRGAHRPPRRPVQPGAAGGGGRGVPRDRRSCARPRWSARTRRPCRCAA